MESVIIVGIPGRKTERALESTTRDISLAETQAFLDGSVAAKLIGLIRFNICNIKKCVNAYAAVIVGSRMNSVSMLDLLC